MRHQSLISSAIEQKKILKKKRTKLQNQTVGESNPFQKLQFADTTEQHETLTSSQLLWRQKTANAKIKYLQRAQQEDEQMTTCRKRKLRQPQGFKIKRGNKDRPSCWGFPARLSWKHWSLPISCCFSRIQQQMLWSQRMQEGRFYILPILNLLTRVSILAVWKKNVPTQSGGTWVTWEKYTTSCTF